MLGYVTLGTNDMARAAEFHDSPLEPIGGKRLMDVGTFMLWDTSLGEDYG